MARGLRLVASLADPVGETIDGWVRPNGLEIRQVRVPLGVVGIIYENRPNVTSDAAALCLKSGNAALLARQFGGAATPTRPSPRYFGKVMKSVASPPTPSSWSRTPAASRSRSSCGCGVSSTALYRAAATL